MGDPYQVPTLQVSELYKRRQSKDSARLRAYNQILESIHNRIRVQSQLPTSPCSLLYTIPPFILGLPRIDLEDCVVYLVYQLRHTGFEVRYSYPNLLSISWRHHEKSYIMEQSPIMQAMIASNQTLKDKQHSKSTALFNKKPKKPKNPNVAEVPKAPKNVVISPYALEGVSAGKVPSSSDYVPPSVFLNKMDNPEPKAETESGIFSWR